MVAAVSIVLSEPKETKARNVRHCPAINGKSAHSVNKLILVLKRKFFYIIFLFDKNKTLYCHLHPP